ncbi:hypothetical protein C7I55_10445 [Sphingomonas deserti]|uniref:Uncharacterized protein n=1 Tax=Allosphingosinicella deserti TaxID=2116704 RepID=A0A2P7QRW9_9SPHN|nr:hypothetical protein C7I55_10445 [Sphingomonas deserti]
MTSAPATHFLPPEWAGAFGRKAESPIAGHPLEERVSGADTWLPRQARASAPAVRVVFEVSSAW